ncbi:MAG: Crp/Fnr family transcriptional regulator [Gammaproteobacteria bacterium]|jgi:CRP-like cAMP-binding protein|nr:Crp/Fnr family transcriptional regulator [Gammaproteobacteria bacterium]
MVAAVTLSGIEAFRSLSTDDREALASRCDSRRYAADQQIISHTDSSTDVYFIVSGRVRATIYSSSGKEVSFRDIEAGEIFGDLSAIDGKPRSANVVALTDCLIVSMSAEVLWDTLQRYPDVCAVVLKELTKLVRSLAERVVEFSTLGVKNRIHAELLRLAGKHMQDENSAVISPAPTQADIASRVSTTREAVAREMSHLGQIGVIERRNSALVIGDVARLSRMVQEVRGQ